MNYYKRHLGDYSTDAGHLSLMEHGAYTVLMDRYYRYERAPTRDEALRWTRARSLEEVAAVDAVLGEFFELDGEVYRQGRIDRELSAFHIKQEANRALGARGGEANAKRNAKRTSSESLPIDEANAKPSHKPLAISQEEAKEKARRRPDGPSVTELLAEVDPVVVADFTEHRRAKRAPITPTVLIGIRREAHKAGMSLEDALRTMCERNWQGFKSAWIDDNARGPPFRSANPSKHNAGTAGFLGASHERHDDSGLVLEADRGGLGEPVPALPGRLSGG